jgi:hypothetical protein
MYTFEGKKPAEEQYELLNHEIDRVKSIILGERNINDIKIDDKRAANLGPRKTFKELKNNSEVESGTLISMTRDILMLNMAITGSSDNLEDKKDSYLFKGSLDRLNQFDSGLIALSQILRNMIDQNPWLDNVIQGLTDMPTSPHAFVYNFEGAIDGRRKLNKGIAVIDKFDTSYITGPLDYASDPVILALLELAAESEQLRSDK